MGNTAGESVSGSENLQLLRQAAFIEGRWVPAQSDRSIAVVDPATGEQIGAVPNMGRDETFRAITAARQAQPKWARLTAAERGACLRRWADKIAVHRESLARLMTREQGKPLAEARGEIDYAASFLNWFAAEGERHDGEIITSHLPGRRMFALRVPVGVAAAVTPWNFPSAMITRKAGAALAAGCAMVVRPASETPFSALALAALAEESGIPGGIFSVLTGDPVAIVGAIMEEPAVRQISFTGSTRVGRLLAAQAAQTVKRVAMELGGHAPMIICEDVDLDVAVSGAVAAKFQTGGQDCLAANRIFVAESIYGRFCSRYAEAVQALKVGNGFTPGVDIGPLIDADAVDTCASHVADALACGARLLVGGSFGVPGPLFYTPTVVADITPQMKMFREETFGPVAAVAPFSSDEEVLRLANDSEFGLAAYLYGGNLGRLWRLAEGLEYGMIAFNTVKMTGPPVPFGGMKQSGLGREGSRHGIDEYSEIKYFCINGL